MKIDKIVNVIIPNEHCKEPTKLKVKLGTRGEWSVNCSDYLKPEWFHHIKSDGDGNYSIVYNHAQGTGVIHIPHGMVYSLYEAIRVVDKVGNHRLVDNDKIYVEVE